MPDMKVDSIARFSQPVRTREFKTQSLRDRNPQNWEPWLPLAEVPPVFWSEKNNE